MAIAIPFVLFCLMLGGLTLFHKDKLKVVAGGFLAITLWFVWYRGGTMPWVEHLFYEWHRFHLLYNLALLLPGFALVAHYFEESGASHRLAQVLKSDSSLLWSVFWLSTILDNIAAAMIGGTIVLARYGKHPHVRLLIAVICASNLGGAGSPVGDTTTVMLYIHGVPIPQLLCAFAATIPVQMVVVWWAGSKNGRKPHDEAKELEQIARRARKEAAADDDLDLGVEDIEALEVGAHRRSIRWGDMLPMLGIPGLMAGNILFDQPGLGLWAGICIGLVLGLVKPEIMPGIRMIPNTLFLLTLVASAELLPLPEIQHLLEIWSRDRIAVAVGVLSAWLDNIPLTAICMGMGGFDWGLLAYTVGFGGSALWFGSSAGVALSHMFKELENTTMWLKSYYFVVTSFLFIGAGTYWVTFDIVAPLIMGEAPTSAAPVTH